MIASSQALMERASSKFMSDATLNSYSNTSYHNEELKSLTPYRFDKVQERAQLKQSVSKLVTILFPQLGKTAPTLNITSVSPLLSELHSVGRSPFLT